MSLITISSKSQLNIAYSMGVMGGDLKVSSSSNPLTVNMTNCIQVTNGVSKFLTTNVGDFVNNCAVDLNYARISIQVLPNPFTDAVNVKFKSKISNDNHFKISVFNNLGQLQKMENVYQDLFYSGFKMQLAGLPSGVYFLHINSGNISEIFKIIKNE